MKLDWFARPAARPPIAAGPCGGCVGAIASRPGPTPGPGPTEETVPVGAAGLPSALLAPVSGMRRLTSYEYDNTLRDLLGDSSRPSRTVLPTDVRTPFDNDWTA